MSLPRVVSRFLLTLIPVLLGIILYIGSTPTAADAHVSSTENAHDHPAQSAGPGLCESTGLVSVAGTELCTHGPDIAPPGATALELDAPVFSASAAAGSAVCDGDGTSGKRVQVLYARGSDVPDRFSQYATSLQTWAAAANRIFDASAEETGGHRYIRFAHGSDCMISITAVTLTSRGDNSFSALLGELAAQGYNRNDRKYMVFLDQAFAGVCGQGTTWLDDRAGASNYNNTLTGYATIYNGCWGDATTAAHELAHALGAVQDSAPHATGHGHCTDEWDIMCYSDARGVKTTVACTSASHNARLDCNHDDYFHTNPPAGSYLATHWNTASSDWLGGTSVSISLSKDSSKYNGPVVATLTGFKPNSRITLRWDQSATIGTVTADSDGNGSVLFRTPLAVFGPHTVTARDSRGTVVSTTLRVIPRILLNEMSGPENTQLRIYLYGFAAGERVDIQWQARGSQTRVLASVTVASNGRATTLFRVPKGSTVKSSVIVGKVIGVSRSASTAFTVTALRSAEEPTSTPTASPIASATTTPEPTGTATPKPTVTEVPEETSTVGAEPTETPVLESTPLPTDEPILESPVEPSPLPSETPVAQPSEESSVEFTPEPTADMASQRGAGVAFRDVLFRSKG